jgi:hypothetical protein
LIVHADSAGSLHLFCKTIPATGELTCTGAASRESAAAQLFPRRLCRLLAAASLQIIAPPHSSAALRP